MGIAHSFMRIHIHRDCFMSIARYEHSSYFGPMYEHSSYYDNGFIIDELMLYLIMLSCFHDPYFNLSTLVKWHQTELAEVLNAVVVRQQDRKLGVEV